MIWAARQLLVPCNYLRIKCGETATQSKAVYDFLIPAVLTGATAGVCLVLDVPLSFFQQANLFTSVSSLLAILVGFYMAALAAVATFDRPGIDAPLKGSPATLVVRDHENNGVKVVKTLSYRQFISYLFGYLSFLSFIIYVTLLILNSTWAKITSDADEYLVWRWLVPHIMTPGIFLVVFFLIWQLFITSLLGIYFLAERLQSLNDPHS